MDQPNESLDPSKWVDMYGDYLFAFAKTRVKDYEYAKDLVQDTFLAAIPKVDSFKGGSSIKTWLTAILKNKIIDSYRKKKVEFVSSDFTYSENTGIDFFDDLGRWNASYKPLEIQLVENNSLENKDLQKILKDCFEKLPSMWRMVFILKNVDEEKSSLICKEMNITPSNFWVIIHRAKLSLRECIVKADPIKPVLV